MITIRDFKIRGYHIDVFGHVNHAKYVRLMEESRWDYLDQNKDVNESMISQGIGHCTVHISIGYKNPAVMGDVLRVETGVCRKSRRSITFSQNMFVVGSGNQVAYAEVVNVFFRKKTREILETDSEVFSIWEDLLQAPFMENAPMGTP